MNHYLEMISRSEQLRRLRETEVWQVVVIGGGASGLGAALEAASRGYACVLFEQADFAKGTSSKATKLVHGGVRYLKQGDVKLVREALRERGILLKNAPHVTKKQAFIIPCYTYWDLVFYGVGLRVYDALSGRWRLGKTQVLEKKEVLTQMPGVNAERLKGGILYYDGQFDDSRLALNLAQTFFREGGLPLNYMQVCGFLEENGKLHGVTVQDMENGETFEVYAEVVINATGVWVDEIARLEDAEARKTVTLSQGAHVVLNRDFFPSETALMIPKTSDGRVLFAIPWHNKVVLGTTDRPVQYADLEPKVSEEEIAYILETAKPYLAKSPIRTDVLSCWAGLRPLAAPNEEGGKTKEISRSHKIYVSPKGLISIVGGKWTTYRAMGEELINEAEDKILGTHKSSKTKDLKLYGCKDVGFGTHQLAYYGTDEQLIRALMVESPEFAKELHPNYPFKVAHVVWAARYEMARTIEDVLARRTRWLLLDAKTVLEAAPLVAKWLAKELGWDEQWEAEQVRQFRLLVHQYCGEDMTPRGT